uniref:Src y 3 domain n=1 Tax=Echinococcus granulosus TaxID=6210 RepID=A0A068WB28_ECHGR|nr:Src y 3 domain [Echinococcus granulosus]
MFKNNISFQRSLTFFPDSSTCDLEKELKEVKSRLEEASKRIKDAEVLKRNYLANKNMHEKANDQEKEQEKRVMEDSRRKLSDFVKELDQCIPQMLAKNDEELYKYMLKYFTSKCEYLNSTLSETRKILNQMKFARESNPASSKYPRVSPLSPSSPPGHQAPSNGSTADDNAYTQPLNPPPKSATDDHQAEGTAASTHPTVSNSDSRHNGLGTSTHDQANSELASRTPPFDVIAAFAYTSEEQDELDFKVDERITVLPWENSEDEEPGWLYGKHHGSGLKGLFPANYKKAKRAYKIQGNLANHLTLILKLQFLLKSTCSTLQFVPTIFSNHSDINKFTLCTSQCFTVNTSTGRQVGLKPGANSKATHTNS